MIAAAVLGQVGQQGVDPVSHALLYPRRFYSNDELRALRPLISDFDRGPLNDSTGSETAVNGPLFNAENEQNYAISYEGSRDPVSTRPSRYKSLFATEADLDKGHEGARFSLYHEYERNPALRVYGAQLTAPTLHVPHIAQLFSAFDPQLRVQPKAQYKPDRLPIGLFVGARAPSLEANKWTSRGPISPCGSQVDGSRRACARGEIPKTTGGVAPSIGRD